MIAGKEQPDSGAVKISQTVKMAFVEQSREGLEGDKTVFEDVAGGADILTVGKFEMPSRAYLGRFNFKGGDQQKKSACSPAANAAACTGQNPAQGRQCAAAG